jgi:hypothetical protein
LHRLALLVLARRTVLDLALLVLLVALPGALLVLRVITLDKDCINDVLRGGLSIQQSVVVAINPPKGSNVDDALSPGDLDSVPVANLLRMPIARVEGIQLIGTKPVGEHKVAHDRLSCMAQ